MLTKNAPICAPRSVLLPERFVGFRPFAPSASTDWNSPEFVSKQSNYFFCKLQPTYEILFILSHKYAECKHKF